MIDLSWIDKPGAEESLHYWKGLTSIFQEMGSAVVAFSGGVDSGLLCAAAFHALGDKMLAVTVHSPVESAGDVQTVVEVGRQVGFPVRIIEYNDLDNPQFVNNPPDRCYHCKLGRFTSLKQIALAQGYANLVEGSNADDSKDYRPGWRAVQETGTRSPLVELGMGKKEIRTLAKYLGLTIWDRASKPCLATRFPYGSEITEKGLHQVANGEDYLQKFGFKSIRVRHHGSVARLEVDSNEIEKLVNHRKEIQKKFHELGFIYTAVDLAGYRSGSLNEELT